MLLLTKFYSSRLFLSGSEFFSKQNSRIFYNFLLTNDIVDGGMVGAGYEVGEKVNHYHALLLSLKNDNYRLFCNKIETIFLQLPKLKSWQVPKQYFLSVLSIPH